MNRLYAAAMLAMILFTVTSCRWRSVRGNGNVITSNRNEGTFNGVKTAGSFDLYVTQGDDYSVRIEAEENLMKYILTEVENGELKVRVKRGVNLRPRQDMKVFVTAPRFKELGIAGSGNIIAETNLSSDSPMEFSISGSGDIRAIAVDAPKITVRIAGSGNASLAGSTRDAVYRIAGSGDIKCRDLKTENTEVHIAGGGNVWSYCSQNLDVHIAGSGDVHYAGNPVNVKQKIAGSGNMIKE
ncbi:MAG TPA: head GIN domain-containing protein [Lacibacter sp.]|nr:head GIN domain-containing protein [Lacibacter sp.]